MESARKLDTGDGAVCVWKPMEFWVLFAVCELCARGIGAWPAGPECTEDNGEGVQSRYTFGDGRSSLADPCAIPTEINAIILDPVAVGQTHTRRLLNNHFF